VGEGIRARYVFGGWGAGEVIAEALEVSKGLEIGAGQDEIMHALKRRVDLAEPVEGDVDHPGVESPQAECDLLDYVVPVTRLDGLPVMRDDPRKILRGLVIHDRPPVSALGGLEAEAIGPVCGRQSGEVQPATGVTPSTSVTVTSHRLPNIAVGSSSRSTSTLKRAQFVKVSVAMTSGMDTGGAIPSQSHTPSQPVLSGRSSPITTDPPPGLGHHRVSRSGSRYTVPGRTSCALTGQNWSARYSVAAPTVTISTSIRTIGSIDGPEIPHPVRAAIPSAIRARRFTDTSLLRSSTACKVRLGRCRALYVTRRRRL